MANRIRSVDQATYVGRRTLRELGDELREARLRAGVRQVDVATALGTSHTQISRVERGAAPGVALLNLAAHAGAVGLRLHARVYPSGPPVRDRAQLELLDRFRRRISPQWLIRIEAPVADRGDLRAWDMLLSSREATIGVEAITRLRDVQAQVRLAQLKRRDARVTRLILLVAATHANRRALATTQPVLRSEFGVATRTALAALAAGRDPGADALIIY